jgi:ABC-type multidrug transport system fused ATPase/permease subunit
MPADMAIMLENGRIVAQGRHQKLLEQSGAYYALLSKQFEATLASAE